MITLAGGREIDNVGARGGDMSAVSKRIVGCDVVISKAIHGNVGVYDDGFSKDPSTEIGERGIGLGSAVRLSSTWRVRGDQEAFTSRRHGSACVM
jgi:hypothetical protein